MSNNIGHLEWVRQFMFPGDSRCDGDVVHGDAFRVEGVGDGAHSRLLVSVHSILQYRVTVVVFEFARLCLGK